MRTTPYSSTPSPPSPKLKRWPTGVALHHRNLTTIYTTHGHFDHFAGLSVLLQRFPEARAIATPKSVELMRKQSQAIPLFRKLWPGQLPARIVLPEAYDKDVFTPKGHELRIIEQARTDAVDTSSLHVPSLDLVVGGDVFYNQCHMYVGDTTAESRANWIAAPDRLAALNPKIAVPATRSQAPRTPRRPSRRQNAISPTSAGSKRRNLAIANSQPPGLVDVRPQRIGGCLTAQNSAGVGRFRETSNTHSPNNISIRARISFAKRRIGYREKLGASDEIAVSALRSLV